MQLSLNTRHQNGARRPAVPTSITSHRAAPDRPVRRQQLDGSHPLAEVAKRHCHRHAGPHIGNVACGACWELAIRDDERFVVECDLPRTIEPDPDYIDEIAVSLACRGERVALTPPELATAAARLRGRGLYPIEIARRLHVAYGAVLAALAPPAGSDAGTGRAA